MALPAAQFPVEEGVSYVVRSSSMLCYSRKPGVVQTVLLVQSVHVGRAPATHQGMHRSAHQRTLTPPYASCFRSGGVTVHEDSPSAFDPGNAEALQRLPAAGG